MTFPYNDGITTLAIVVSEWRIARALDFGSKSEIPTQVSSLFT